ncbi:MAG TPA: hypothetical protein VNN73_17465 [Blastocatellia bacterium]|nr:hypothetical protein [Blastocatellia bacterium]
MPDSLIALEIIADSLSPRFTIGVVNVETFVTVTARETDQSGQSKSITLDLDYHRTLALIHALEHALEHNINSRLSYNAPPVRF